MIETVVHCSHIGICGTTEVYVRPHPGGFEARVGIAILGATNRPLHELAEANPFDDDFHDNYAVGLGLTHDAALEALKADMQRTAESLWA